jgi:hypothetical protein
VRLQRAQSVSDYGADKTRSRQSKCGSLLRVPLLPRLESENAPWQASRAPDIEGWRGALDSLALAWRLREREQKS